MAIIDRYRESWFVAQTVSWIVFWLAIVVNDMFVLTVDFKRTNTYAGCVAAQAGLNFCFGGLGVLSQALYSLTGIPVILASFCSICLLIISLWPAFVFRSQVPMQSTLSFNTKDAFGGTVSSAGTPRAPNSWLTYSFVEYVESRIYAFSRNFFAVVAAGILLFRTVTALLQAQNEIGTRMTSANCDGRAASVYNLGILMERLTFDSRWNTSSSRGTSPIEDIDITVSASWRGARRGQKPFGTRNCTILWSKESAGIYIGYQNRTVELFGCPTYWTDKVRNYPQSLRQSENSDIFVYDIQVHPRNPKARVLEGQMPYIWFLNAKEIPYNLSHFDVNDFEVRDYTPPWELLPGSHIEAEAKLITRRFISSSIMKDVVLNSEPLYRPLSLFPIAESSVAPLKSSNASSATATIHASLTPGLMYLRNQAEAQNRALDNICDFIDDYRSGSVLDVIGSVGGLFALLQAIHLLLFGRPLFWGLAGAKLISPFGLFGKCSSRGFKRRLRDEYHTQDAKDGSDTIQIVNFLRDFVIEFGPADLEPDRSSPQQLVSPSLEVKGDEPHTQVALMQMDSGPTLVHQKENAPEDNAKWSSERFAGGAQV
ncbi:hypothetical protein OPQ81_000223 [Rhizoctonia solani]|nr:hypothetical protein OPQ81_000223 [Rhizoctonia solani]